MPRYVTILTVLFIVTLPLFCTESCAQNMAVSSPVKKEIVKLQFGSPRQKIDAARKLGSMGAEATPAVPYIIELLDSSEIYESLFDKLWNSTTILSNSGKRVNYESEQALIRIGRPAVKQLSNALLKHPRNRVRATAAIVLGNIKDLQSVDPLIAGLRTDAYYEVRMWSAEALGKMAEKWSIDVLGNAVAALMEALRDQDLNVRQKAAYALGKMKAMKVVPALIEALRTDGKNGDAGLALFMITGQRFGDDPQRWLEWWNQHSRN